jgi:hypothetical protein
LSAEKAKKVTNTTRANVETSGAEAVDLPIYINYKIKKQTNEIFGIP